MNDPFGDENMEKELEVLASPIKVRGNKKAPSKNAYLEDSSDDFNIAPDSPYPLFSPIDL